MVYFSSYYFFTYLSSNFRVPRVRWMMLDKYEERDKTQTRVYREISWKQNALDLTERVPWQCEIQRQTCKSRLRNIVKEKV